MGVSIGKCARQPRFSIGKCARQPRFSIGKCVNTNLSCGGIVPKWADKLPKQELFHRNLEPRRRVKETSPHPLGTRARKLHMVGAVGRPRICCANTHRLRTLRVRLTLAPSRVRVPPASKRSEPASLRNTGSKAPYGTGGGTRTHNPCGERF